MQHFYVFMIFVCLLIFCRNLVILVNNMVKLLNGNVGIFSKHLLHFRGINCHIAKLIYKFSNVICLRLLLYLMLFLLDCRVSNLCSLNGVVDKRWKSPYLNILIYFPEDFLTGLVDILHDLCHFLCCLYRNIIIYINISP